MDRKLGVVAAVVWLGACGQAEVPAHGDPPEPPSPTCRQLLAAAPPPTGSLLADAAAPFALPPLQADVRLYELEVDPADLAAMAADPDSDELRKAVFVIDGRRVPALLRYRGNSSRDWPKKSYRVEFPDDTGFDGRHKLNLVSEWKDCTLMVEKLGYDLLAALGVPAPRATYVRLQINGEYQGVYLDLERVDKTFTAAHGFPDDDPTIYRCGRKDCEMRRYGVRAEFQKDWEKKTNEGEDDLGLETLLCAINAAPEPELPEVLDAHLELELYLRSMVADALISNDVIEDSRSYLVHDAVLRRWHYVIWDLNNSTTRYQPGSRVGTLAHVDHPLFSYSVFDAWSEQAYQERIAKDPDRDWHPLFSNLNTRIAFHPGLRERFLARLEAAMGTLFTPETFGARVDEIHALLAPWIPGDANVYPEKFADGPRYLKDYLARRTDFLRAEIARYRAAPAGVELAEFDPQKGQVALSNRGPDTVDLSGWTLTTDLRRRPAPNLSGNLGPGVTRYFDLAALGLETGPEGELGLWRGPALPDVVDVLFLGGLDPGRRYVRDAHDATGWHVVP